MKPLVQLLVLENNTYTTIAAQLQQDLYVWSSFTYIFQTNS